VGIDFSQWTSTSGLTVTNGAVFFMDSKAGAKVDNFGQIPVGRFTVPRATSTLATFGVSGRGRGGGVEDQAFRTGTLLFTPRNLPPPPPPPPPPHPPPAPGGGPVAHKQSHLCDGCCPTCTRAVVTVVAADVTLAGTAGSWVTYQLDAKLASTPQPIASARTLRKPVLPTSIAKIYASQDTPISLAPAFNVRNRYRYTVNVTSIRLMSHEPCTLHTS
jgi:hypothetical protein